MTPSQQSVSDFVPSAVRRNSVLWLDFRYARTVGLKDGI